MSSLLAVICHTPDGRFGSGWPPFPKGSQPFGRPRLLGFYRAHAVITGARPPIHCFYLTNFVSMAKFFGTRLAFGLHLWPLDSPGGARGACGALAATAPGDSAGPGRGVNRQSHTKRRSKSCLQHLQQMTCYHLRL